MSNIDKLIIHQDASILHALKQINEGRQGILLLVDGLGKLLRTITDGDIRRLLLKNMDMKQSLDSLPWKEPIIACEDANTDSLVELMQKHKINQIPIVDQENRPVTVVHLNDLDSPILLSTPHMGEDEQGFIAEAFDSNWIAPLGPNVDAFEEELTEKVGISHAAAMSSGTAAIHLALILLGVGRGDRVYCSTLTFAASANPIMYQAAEPVFIDSEYSTWNMSSSALRRALEKDNSEGTLPKAVIIVNLYGQSADMNALLALCNEYEIPVIEDAAESLGARYQGNASGTFGRLGVYSFNGNKIITTSGGGMLVSDDGELIEKARYLSTQARDPAPYYYHTQVGYNYRMSNVLAGIGRGQLQVLEERVESRRRVFERYVNGFRDVDHFTWMPEPEGYYSNRWLSCFTLKPESGCDIPNLIQEVAKKKIECRHLWYPMHRQPLFENYDYYPHEEGISVSDELFLRGMCLPSGSNLTESQQVRVIDTLKDAIHKISDN